MGQVIRSLALLIILSPSWVQARPEAPDLFCGVYPNAPSCPPTSGLCQTCHGSGIPSGQNFNPFGHDVQAVLGTGAFSTELGRALRELESVDSDDDGFDNLTEISLGSLPGDGLSVPTVRRCENGQYNPDYNVCGQDLAYTYRRVWFDFCGAPPPHEAAIDLAGISTGQQRQAIVESLRACLRTDYWMGEKGALLRIFYPMLQPLSSFDVFDTLEPATYLTIWANTEDRDAREMLLAQHSAGMRPAEGDGPPEYFPTPFCIDRGILDPANCPRTPSGARDWAECDCSIPIISSNPVPQSALQPVPLNAPVRAGILTSGWFQFYNTMFTAIPRVTAAQAYRSFAGLDIAYQEGLIPTNRPIEDWDGTGVTDAQCVVCHDTLDNMAYVFGQNDQQAGWNPFRVIFFANEFPGIENAPKTSFVFEQEVRSIREWAEVVANSDAFAAEHVRKFWSYLIGHEPRGDELIEFNGVWQAFRHEHGYRTEDMLQDLVFTGAYSEP